MPGSPAPAAISASTSDSERYFGSDFGRRGERLRAMQDKSAAMSDDAAGFAELAKQLADRERGRAKWFG